MLLFFRFFENISIFNINTNRKGEIMKTENEIKEAEEAISEYSIITILSIANIIGISIVSIIFYLFKDAVISFIQGI